MEELTKICKKCKEEINQEAKKCPHCGSKQGFNFVIPLVVIFIFLLIIIPSGEDDPNINKDVEVEVIEFSNMEKNDIKAWCEEKKVNCVFEESYSDTEASQVFLSQSVEPKETVYEGEKIVIKHSLGKEPTTEFKNALKKAESYSEMMNMSKERIYQQLISEHGEKFPEEAAKYAIENIEADWNENALKTAKSYQESMSMSKDRIYDQLVSEHGEKFTKEQAQYAIDHLDE